MIATVASRVESAMIEIDMEGKLVLQRSYVGAHYNAITLNLLS